LRSTPTQSNGQSARSPSITKNALFAGSEGGGENSAVIASLIETSKLCGVDSYANLADVLAKIVNGH
jgi:transposase